MTIMTTITRSQAAKYNINKSINEIEWLAKFLNVVPETQSTPLANKYRKMFYLQEEEEDEEEDAEYNVRCENGEAKCEECGKWGQALDMEYDDDTGFHICCE